ncbi:MULTISPECIES: cell division protein FtsA [unclassified Oceanobacillus]|uniref:cell division protein FtsA n=1 Tax=unclassified Oceanobacillus TaxID=2630292 RepID=UPI0012EBD9EC|nr:pilus assembly protein PilM [Oceanobacillus sp. AG]
MENIIFALDIGTRSVTGVIVRRDEDSIQLIDYCMIEHEARSMRDGQIHDVPAVAATIKKVKESLEISYGSPLHKVCVAAAGRSLKTIEASATIDLTKFPIKNEEDVKHLELAALQAAQEKLGAKKYADSYQNYHCVGYSLLYYKLDKERIGSLIKQTGNEASAEVIATFLPKVVVESLLTAVKMANLEVEAMTLEPIAALHVLIPESMRRLNVVLVDIGAGTSDIAITEHGTVVSYGMVPLAGDEITEALSDQYLLDFPEAEKVKRKVVLENETEIEDILGFTSTITYDAFVDHMKDEINRLATVIAEEIKKLNGKAPRAVMLVGGGSLTPTIANEIAVNLNLPPNRVAIRGVEAIQQLQPNAAFPGGPLFVTPIGIAITAKERPVQYTEIIINEETIRLFEVNEQTIGDALIQAGLKIHNYYGKPGIAAMIKVNGKEVTIPGGFGESPTIYLNDEPATTETRIKQMDVIKLEKGRDGDAAAITLEELIGETKQIRVKFKDTSYSLGTIYTVNGKPKPPSYYVQDKDDIHWSRLESVQDFLDFYKLGRDVNLEFPIIVNQKKIDLPVGKTTILVNDKEATTETVLHDGDELKFTSAKTPIVKDIFEYLGKSDSYSIQVTFNKEPVSLYKPAYMVTNMEKILHNDSELHPYIRLTMKERETPFFVFQDVFRHVALDLTHATGNFKLYCNDERAGFDTPIHDRDSLAIVWDD